MFKPVLALLAAGAAIAPAALNAAPVVVVSDGVSLTRQMHVQTDDLNLTSAAGKRTLQQRVSNAVTAVCGVGESDNFDEIQCRHAAVAAAKVQVADAMARATPHFAEAKPAPAPTNTASGS